MKKRWRYVALTAFSFSSLLLGSHVLAENAQESGLAQSSVVTSAEKQSATKQEVHQQQLELKQAVQEQVNQLKEDWLDEPIKMTRQGLVFNYENIHYSYSIASVMKGGAKVYRAVDNGNGYQRLEVTSTSDKFLHRTVTAIVKIGNQEFYQFSVSNDNQPLYVAKSAVTLSSHWGYGAFINTNDRYATIVSSNGYLQTDLDGGWKGQANDYAGQTFKVQGYYELVTDGTRLYRLVDSQNRFFAYAKADILQFNDQPWGNKKALNQYMTVTKTDYKIYQDKNWHSNKKTDMYKNQTFKVKESYRHMNAYGTVYNNKNQCLGFVNLSALQKASTSWGIGFKMEKSVIVNQKNMTAYSSPGKASGKSSQFYNKNYLVRKYYKAFDGKTYYELYDTDKKRIAGYVQDKATKERPWGFGDPYHKTQYLTVMSQNFTTYQNQRFAKKGKTSAYYHQTLKAKTYYKHTNGNIYLSVYDKKNKWVGYVNADAGDLSNHAMGAKINETQYMGIAKTNYRFYKDLNLKKQTATTKTYRTTTLKSTGYYANYNGRRYDSVRSKDKWIGYVNRDALKKTDSWGLAHGAKDYFTVLRDDYNVYANRSGKKKGSSSKNYHKTYRVKTYYKRYDGLTYYSFYDHHDKWQGYTCSKAGKKGSSPWGEKLNANKSGFVSSSNYYIYKDKNWSKKCKTSKYKNKDITTTGYYAHYNGGRYYSMYYQNKWVGYVSYKALSGRASNQIASNGVYQYVLNIAKDVQNKYGGVITSGYRPGSVNELGQADDHSRRCAIDISGVSYNTYEKMKKYIVSKYKNAGLKYVIANNTWATPSSGWGFVHYPYGGHLDHIHISCNMPVAGASTTF